MLIRYKKKYIYIYTKGIFYVCFWFDLIVFCIILAHMLMTYFTKSNSYTNIKTHGEKVLPF